MRINDWIYLVGSDQFGISDPRDSNIYLLDGGDEIALVDTGRVVGQEAILACIQTSGFKPAQIATILLTHHHGGHSEACALYRERWGTRVIAHQNSVPFLSTGDNDEMRFLRALGNYDDSYRFPTFTPDTILQGGETFNVGRLQVKAIHVRGHTDDSICYLVEADGQKALFTGDTVFFDGLVGLVNLPGCSIDDYRTDIVKLADLGNDMLMPGHGVFVMRGGQGHVDDAIAQFYSRVRLPRSYFEGIRHLRTG